MRAETLALLAAAYLAVMFVLHRLRVHRRRASGPSLEVLARFDYRALWDELLPALPAREGAAAPRGEAPTAPRFYATSPWELPEPFAHRAERDALAQGGVPAADARDPELAWLFAHFAVRRILEGDLDGARAVAERLEEGLAARLLSTIELARAERAQAALDLPAARAHAAAAAGLVRGLSSAGADYLAEHVRLGFLTHELNLELAVGGAVLALRRAIARHGERPFLHLGLARAHALLGRHGEALDEIARALYYAQGDAFYRRVILDDGFVFRARPALAAQCRPTGERPALSPEQAGR